ncbi:MAG: AAA family ATPase [Clostridia bacterium]|nr:AAA family ATPase [Clostridia bacterium]
MNFGNINKIQVDGNIFQNSELQVFPIQKNVTCRISNIYGKNGSGKTTISKAIKGNSLEKLNIKFIDSENNEIICDTREKIYVYDEEFIDTNVKTSEDGIKTVIMLGEQKELDDKIIKLKEERDDLKKKETKLKSEVEKFQNSNNNISPLYFKNLIEQKLKDGWAVRDKEIKGNKRNSSFQYNELIGRINKVKGENNNKKELLEEYYKLLNTHQKVTTGTSKLVKSLDKITFFSENYESTNKLLKKKVEIPEFTEREKIILEKIEDGEQKFYEAVREEFKKDEVNICPYCFQSISNIKDEIVASINKVLNKDVEQHKEELEIIKQKYMILPELDDDFKILDEKLFLEMNNLQTKINNQVKEIQSALDYKINNVYTPSEYKNNNILDLEKEYNTLIDVLENKRREFNLAIDDKEKNNILLNKLNLQISWCDIEDNYKLYEIQEKQFEQIKVDSKQNYEKIKETKEEITKLESEKQNVKIANDKINIFLEYIFMSKNRLRIEYDVNKKIYLVKSHNKDIRPKDLSTGERNIIALCYFFVKILENTSEINEFKEEIFIVLDDPISSFDMENKVGLFTFLRMMFNKIMNNNEGSKIISFTHSLETMFNLEKICSDIKINLNITYCLLELKNSKLEDFAYKRRNDYKKMLEDIYKYAKIEDDKIENELDDTIGNTMRKLLEAYSTFNYNKGIEEVTRNKNILEKVENEDIKQYFENFMYRLILNNESHTFDETRSLDFYDFISRDEKIKTARSILILLNILDNTHLKAYLDGEDYIKELKIWENEIIPKKTIAN